MSEQVEHITETAPHLCQVCQSPEYQRAIAIIQHSGMDPDKWGFLLHDIARALRATSG